MATDLSQDTVHLRHIIPLDFDSLNSTQQWNSQHVFIGVESKDVVCSLPVVDLDSPTAEESLIRACESWGMFQLTNHGIPSSLLEEVEAESLRFFSLPRKEKMKVLRAPGKTFGYGVAALAAILDEDMWHEGFTMTGSPIEHAKQVFPHDYMRFCEIMEIYQKRMKSLSEKLLAFILKNDVVLLDLHDSNPATVLQLNSYPACRCPNYVNGLSPHTDTSFVTIVHRNDMNGLQLFRQGRGWVPVAAETGSLVVNVGDMLHIISNARFSNSLHRAVPSPTGHRVSMAFFYCPPPDLEISPFVTACTTSSPQAAKFRPITRREFVSMKAEKIDALSLIKIT